MKKLHLFVLLLSFLALPVAILASGDHEPASVTVRGEVLDLACYLAHGAKGADHAGCAKLCVKAGQPMGLLASDGNVYVLYAGHDDSSAYDATKEFAGKQVEITGKMGAKSELRGIEVTAVKAI